MKEALGKASFWDIHLSRWWFCSWWPQNPVPNMATRSAFSYISDITTSLYSVEISAFFYFNVYFVLATAWHKLFPTDEFTLGRYAHCFLLHYGKNSIFLISLYYIFVWLYSWLSKRGFWGFFLWLFLLCRSSRQPEGWNNWHLWGATDGPPQRKPEASFKISWICITMFCMFLGLGFSLCLLPYFFQWCRF